MIAAIHQPEHWPWLGFLDKASRADRFVLLDHVQYRRRYFQNRNKIRSPDGFIWLTVPVLAKGRYAQAINEVAIDNAGEPRWREKCLNSIRHCYARAPYFAQQIGFFEGLYRRPWERLADLNGAILVYLFKAFSIRAEVTRSSQLQAEGQKGDLMLEICGKLGASSYLSGISGREYLDPERFKAQGISLQIQEFRHPIYSQLHEPFLPCMSAIDLLFNHGPQSAQILRGAGVPRMEQLFV